MSETTMTARLASHLETAVAGARGISRLLRTEAFETSTPEGRGRERHRRVLLSAAAAAVAKFVSVATALITVPLTLDYLGSERYGMWMTMSSITAMFTFADLGMGHGILNVVAQSSGTGDRAAIRWAASSGLFALSITAAAILIIFGAIYPFVPWAEVFNVKSETAQLEAGPALGAVVVCFALAIPLGVVSRIQMGLQEGFAANLWRCLGSVLGLVAVLVVVMLQGGLVWLVLGSLGGPIVAYVLNAIHFFGTREPDLSPRRAFISREMIVRIAKIGFLFFGLQIAMAITFASDNVVIAQMLGAEAVTQYAVPEKLFNLVGLVVGMVLFPLWPAYGEAIARGDRAWVRSTLFRSLLWSCVVTTVLSAILVVFGSRIIELWAGSTVHPTLMLLLGLGVWKVVEAGGNAVSMLLNGANVVRFQLILAAIMAVLAIVLKVWLVGHIGLAGVIWATVIAHLATIPPTIWYVQRWLKT